MLSLSGKTALVTGGSRGIGRAVCLLFGELGAKVAVNYVRQAGAAGEVVERIRSAGGEACAIRADVSLVEEAARLVDETVSRLGALDVLVVSHGIWKHAPLDSMTLDHWNETIGINITGAYAVCREAARRMLARRSGAIVIIASTAGQRGEAEYAHYAATKGAALAFTKSLARELAPVGIRVNGVAPGWVLTDMTRDVFEDEARRARALRPIPLGRPGRPDEIAGPVAFLASDSASFLCGEIVCVNGGAVMVG